MSLTVKTLLGLSLCLSGGFYLEAQEQGCYNNCGSPGEVSVYRQSTTECSASWPDPTTLVTNYGGYTVTVLYDVAFFNSQFGGYDQEQTYNPSSTGTCDRWGNGTTDAEVDCDPYWHSTEANVICVDEGDPYYQADVVTRYVEGQAECSLGDDTMAAFFGFDPEMCQPCPSNNDFNCDINIDYCTYYGGCPPGGYFPDDDDACCIID